MGRHVIKIYKSCGRGRGTLVRQLLVIRRALLGETGSIALSGGGVGNYTYGTYHSHKGAAAIKHE